MRAAEFMRALADIIDALDKKPSANDEPQADDAAPVMVSPQQQEIELKKAELGKKSVVSTQLTEPPEEDEIT